MNISSHARIQWSRTTFHQMIFAMLATTAFVLSLNIAGGLVSYAHAGSCGGVNQKTCTFFQRGLKACDSGLAAKGGYCRHCGGKNQMECPVTVQFPSCDRTLAAKEGICRSCGGNGEMECPVTVQVPSCDSTLAAKGGVCRPCGGLNEMECPVTVQFPSCDYNLKAENGSCVALDCGREGQRACTIVERIPSCDGRLVEDFIQGVCRQNDADIMNMAKDTLSQVGDLIAEIAEGLFECTGAQHILEGGGDRKSQADSLGQEPCVRSLIDAARYAGYESLSLGLGGDKAVILGVDGEAGIMFDTHYILPPAFYISAGYSIGLQAGAGASFVAGLGTSAPATNTETGHGAWIGAKVVGGSTASAWFNYDGEPDGISVALTAGAGFSAAYGRNVTQIIEIPGAKAPTSEYQKNIVGNFNIRGLTDRWNEFMMIDDAQMQVRSHFNDTGTVGNWHNFQRLNNDTFEGEQGQLYKIIDDNVVMFASGLQGTFSGGRTVRELSVRGETDITGLYSFVDNPSRVNEFAMPDSDTLKVRAIIDGSPRGWGEYYRVSDTEYRALQGSGSYQILGNGNLVWLSNDGRNLRIELSKQHKRTAEGRYVFVDNSSRINEYAMPDVDTLNVRAIINGTPRGWGEHHRVSDIEFNAVKGSGSYQILDNGNLVWLSNDSRNLRIELRKE